MFIRIICIAGLWLALLAGLGGSAQLSRAQEKPIHLRVQMSDVDITRSTAGIAYDEGLFKKNGLDVELFISPAAAATTKRRGVNIPMDHVGGNDAPIWMGGGSPTVVSVVTNATAGDRVILASFDHVMHWNFMGRQELTKPEDLKGKRIGIVGMNDMSGFEVMVLAKRMGWDPKFDVSIMEQGSALDSLQSGAVDVALASQLLQASAMAAGFHSVVDTRPWRVPIAGGGIMSTKTWVKENREATRRFIKSIVEAMAMLKKDPNVAYRAMAKWFNFNRQQQEVSYEGNQEMPRKPYPAVEGIKKTMELYDSLEMRKHKPEDFYDHSFVRELDQSGFIDSLYK